ncbi:MAG: hypothetical protein J6C23_01915 [Clostridia bacterium]|nr:hypothetical protein [Clostridia bacterium]
MKKRFTKFCAMIISSLLAFVMVFSMVGCTPTATPKEESLTVYDFFAMFGETAKNSAGVPSSERSQEMVNKTFVQNASIQRTYTTIIETEGEEPGDWIQNKVEDKYVETDDVVVQIKEVDDKYYAYVKSTYEESSLYHELDEENNTIITHEYYYKNTSEKYYGIIEGEEPQYFVYSKTTNEEKDGDVVVGPVTNEFYAVFDSIESYNDVINYGVEDIQMSSNMPLMYVMAGDEMFNEEPGTYPPRSYLLEQILDITRYSQRCVIPLAFADNKTVTSNNDALRLNLEISGAMLGENCVASISGYHDVTEKAIVGGGVKFVVTGNESRVMMAEPDYGVYQNIAECTYKIVDGTSFTTMKEIPEGLDVEEDLLYEDLVYIYGVA